MHSEIKWVCAFRIKSFVPAITNVFARMALSSSGSIFGSFTISTSISAFSLADGGE